MVRLSGPDAVAIADSVWRGKSLSDVWRAIPLTFGEIIGEDGNPIDMALCHGFPGAALLHGRDTVEFSLHGLAVDPAHDGGQTHRRRGAPPQPENSHAARFSTTDLTWLRPKPWPT